MKMLNVHIIKSSCKCHIREMLDRVLHPGGLRGEAFSESVLDLATETFA